jgi:hypothetical protein
MTVAVIVAPGTTLVADMLQLSMTGTAFLKEPTSKACWARISTVLTSSLAMTTPARAPA